MPLVSVALALLLLVVLIPATVIDLRRRRIPDAITGPGAIAAVVLGLLLEPAGQPVRVISAFMAALLLLVPGLLRPGGMGLGDVKLAFVIGLCLGPVVVVAVFAALLAGSIAAVVLTVRRGWAEARAATIPFGPYLAGGGLLAIVVGGPLLDATVVSL